MSAPPALRTAQSSHRHHCDRHHPRDSVFRARRARAHHARGDLESAALAAGAGAAPARARRHLLGDRSRARLDPRAAARRRGDRRPGGAHGGELSAVRADAASQVREAERADRRSARGLHQPDGEDHRRSAEPRAASEAPPASRRPAPRARRRRPHRSAGRPRAPIPVELHQPPLSPLQVANECSPRYGCRSKPPASCWWCSSSCCSSANPYATGSSASRADRICARPRWC